MDSKINMYKQFVNDNLPKLTDSHPEIQVNLKRKCFSNKYEDIDR